MKLRRLRGVAALLAACTAAPGWDAVSAQTFPIKPVRIVTAEIGGTLDFVARLAVPGLTSALGQQFIIDNRPSGVFTGSIVSKAMPDGHTLLFNGSSFWMLPFVQANVPYDPVRDFAPITLAMNSPLILVVNPALPVKSVKELIALAKSKPGDLNYSSSSTATPQHIAGEMFKSMAGVDILRVPYRGAGPAALAVVTGEARLTFSTAGSLVAHLKSGRLRPLAVTGSSRSTLAPELPTMADAGLPGFNVGSMWGFFAPAKTPRPIVDRLNREIVRVLNQSEIKDKLFVTGIEVVGSTPEQFAARIREDMTAGSKVLKDAGIRPE